ncbi:MAG: hypothetical protein JRI97_05105, partial [Deltaproteobacteria bacterium]|nr:hypothetical protein [Deltaproteobacteria bacterium]
AQVNGRPAVLLPHDPDYTLQGKARGSMYNWPSRLVLTEDGWRREPAPQPAGGAG